MADTPTYLTISQPLKMSDTVNLHLQPENRTCRDENQKFSAYKPLDIQILSQMKGGILAI